MTDKNANPTIELATTNPKMAIEIQAMFFSGRRKEYVLHVDAVEINGVFRTHMIDFAHKTNLPIETVNRYSAKRLAEHAANWKNVPGVKELIAKICEVRGLELTEESKKILEA